MGKGFLFGDKKAFDDWYKRFDIESIKIFSALDALTVNLLSCMPKSLLLKFLGILLWITWRMMLFLAEVLKALQKPDLLPFEGWGDCFVGCTRPKAYSSIRWKEVKEIERKEW